MSQNLTTRRLSRRELLKLGSSAAATLALAACTAPAVPAPAAAPAAPAAAEATKAPAAAPAAKGPVELRLTFWGDLADMPTWKSGIDEWNKVQPNIKIKWENTPWTEYWTKLQTEMAGGSTPDVTGMVSMYSQQYIRQGTLLTLDDFIAKEPDVKMDDFWPLIMKAYKWQNKTFCLPYDLSTMCQMYNKKMFDEAGVKYPTEWTWDEFLDATKKMTKSTKGDGKIDQFGYILPTFDWTIDVPLGSNNARFISEDGMKCMLDTPEAIATLQWMADLRNKHHVAPTPGEAGDIPLFETGKAAITWGNPEFVQNLVQRVGPPRKNDKFLWDVCFFPKKQQNANAVQGGSFAIGKSTKAPNEAWQFIKFYTSAPVLEAMVGKPSRGIPGRRSVAQSLLTDTNPEHQKFFLDAVDLPSTSVFIPAYQQAIDTMTKYMDQVFLGQMTAAEAGPKVVAELNPILQKTAAGA
jgi:multiple sugar transport system substrate-binding protein